MLNLAFDQVLGTALLVIIILSVTDKRNMKIEASLVPVIIGLGLTSIHLRLTNCQIVKKSLCCVSVCDVCAVCKQFLLFSFGLNAGAAINPARDFSPRLLSHLAGWPEPFSAAEAWFWIPLALPHLGGILGALAYKVLVSLHHEELE